MLQTILHQVLSITRVKIFRYCITTNFRKGYFRQQYHLFEIAAESALDGVYIIRTPVAEDVLNTAETVRAYKGLSKVEQAIGCLKTIDLKVRPIYHYLEHRVKAHIFLFPSDYDSVSDSVSSAFSRK